MSENKCYAFLTTYEMLGAEGQEPLIRDSIERAALEEFGADLERAISWAITHRACNILLKFQSRAGYAARLSTFKRVAAAAVSRYNTTIVYGSLETQGLIARTQQVVTELEGKVPGLTSSLSTQAAAAARASLTASSNTPYIPWAGFIWQLYIVPKPGYNSRWHPLDRSTEELSDDVIRMVGANVGIGDVAVICQTTLSGCDNVASSTALLVLAQGDKPTDDKWKIIAKQLTDPPFYTDLYWYSHVLGWSPKKDWSEYDKHWNSRIVRTDVGRKVDWPPVQKSHVPYGINLQAVQHHFDAAERTKLREFFASLAVNSQCQSLMVIEQAPSDSSLAVHDPQQQYFGSSHELELADATAEEAGWGSD
jgi:hypothetical protein